MKTNSSFWKQALFLPLCACALTACGGGGGGGGGGSSESESGGSGSDTPSRPVFDATNWAAHPGAEVAGEASDVEGEPLANKKMTVVRTGNGDGTDTTLVYRFTPGKIGSYTETTQAGEERCVISSYTYEASNKTSATLRMNILKDSGPTQHTYQLTFTSAKNATGIISINGNTSPLGSLTVTFGR